MKFLFTLFLLFFSCLVLSQSYLGYTSSQVNFRDKPSIESKILDVLSTGIPLFLISEKTENNYYHVINILADVEGYVHKNYVMIERELAASEDGIFTPTGKSDSYNPTIEIYNNTSVRLTLKLNDKVYLFAPKERKNLTLPPGFYSYRASSPGVIPDYGSEDIKSNMGYKWEFYIVTN